VIAGYRTTDHKRNEDIIEELGATDINTKSKSIEING
jgi:hypothetical protein